MCVGRRHAALDATSLMALSLEYIALAGHDLLLSDWRNFAGAKAYRSYSLQNSLAYLAILATSPARQVCARLLALRSHLEYLLALSGSQSSRSLRRTHDGEALCST